MTTPYPQGTIPQDPHHIDKSKTVIRAEGECYLCSLEGRRNQARRGDALCRACRREQAQQARDYADTADSSRPW